MLRKIFAYFLLILSFNLIADQDTPYYQVSICGDPNSYVDGCVSAISGSLVLESPKIIIEGKEPIEISERYVSVLKSKLQAPTDRKNQFIGWSYWDYLLAEAGEGHFVIKDQKTQHGLKNWIEITDPSGINLLFFGPKIKDEPNWLTLHTGNFERGIANTSTGEMAAKLNLINTKAVRLDPKTVKFIMPNGEERLYKSQDDYGCKANGEQLGYILQWIKKANGNKIIYSYELHDVVKEIRTTNHDETKVYAWAKFHYSQPRDSKYIRRIKNPDCTITTSDNQKIVFKYNTIKREGEYKNKIVYFLLKEISSNTFSVKYGYVNGTNGIPLLNSITSASGRTTHCDYHPLTKTNWRDTKQLAKDSLQKYRVGALKRPVGEDQAIESTHIFDYNLAETEADSNVTIVKDIYENKTKYHFNNNLMLEKIERYSNDGQFHSSEEFLWGKIHDLTSSFLQAKTFYDKNQIPLFTKTYSYDKKGNLLCETTLGNISGNSPPLILKDHMPIDNGVNKSLACSSFLENHQNLLEKVSNQNELSIHYSYVPNTNLINSEITKHGTDIYHRKFYEYDSDYTLIKILEDDAPYKEITVFQGAHMRTIMYIIPRKTSPFIGMPELIVHKHYDFNTNTEKLDKRIKLDYDNYGNIIAKHVFDSNNKKRFTLHYTYNKRNDLIRETDPLGNEAIYAYDLDHNKIYEKDFSKKETKYTYDLCNRLIEKETYLGSSPHYFTKYAYNKKNHLIKQTDCRGNCVDLKVDLWGNIIENKEPAILTKIGLKSPITHVYYDACSNPVKTISPLGHVTSTTFNIFKQPTKTIYSNNSFETCSYNTDQTLKTHTDKEGLTTEYEYDPLNRKIATSVLSKNKELIKKETYKYEGLNLSEKIDFMGNVTKYSYDGLGRKIEETFIHDKEEIILYSYDSMGYIETETHLGENPLTIEYKRDLLGQILQLEKKNNETLFAMEKYTYDAAGNKTSVSRLVDGKEAIETFSYDLFNRLIKQTDPLGNTTHISYDDFYVDTHGRKGIKKTEINPLKQATITIKDSNQRVLSIEKQSLE